MNLKNYSTTFFLLLLYNRPRLKRMPTPLASLKENTTITIENNEERIKKYLVGWLVLELSLYGIHYIQQTTINRNLYESIDNYASDALVIPLYYALTRDKKVIGLTNCFRTG